jgi:hypothetical protein
MCLWNSGGFNLAKNNARKSKICKSPHLRTVFLVRKFSDLYFAELISGAPIFGSEAYDELRVYQRSG